MFNVGAHSHPYDPYSNPGVSQAPGPRAAAPTSHQESLPRFVNAVKEQGQVPGMTSLPSGIPASRDAHVRSRVHESRMRYVASCVGMSKEHYTSLAVTHSFAELPVHLQHQHAREDATVLAEQSWEQQAAPFTEGWNNSAAHRQTIEAATQEWDREAIVCAAALAQQNPAEQARAPSAPPFRQPGAHSMAAALRRTYALENKVFDEAFGAALAGSPGASGANALTGQFAQLSSDDPSESMSSPGEVAIDKGKRKADAVTGTGESETMEDQWGGHTASSEAYFLPDASPASPGDGEWAVDGELYRDLDRLLEPGAADDPQASGVPPSREGSVDRLIEEVCTAAQKAKRNKQDTRYITRFNTGLAVLNTKEERSRIDPDQGLARYKAQAQRVQPLRPEEALSRKNRKAERAKTLGVGHSAADYDKHKKAELAKKLGVGTSASDYNKYRAAELAKQLGVGTSSSDYQKHQRAELAKKMGVGTSATDYKKHKMAELAVKLGVGHTAVDYENHQRAELAKKRGVGNSAADYRKHQAGELAKKLGVGDSAADYKKHKTAALAIELGVGTSGADYENHQRAELAKKLGVGSSAAAYKKHQAGELAKKLGVGTSAAEYEKHRVAVRKRQADQDPGSET